MTTLAAWRAATAYAKASTVRPVVVQSAAPVPIANGDFEAGDTAWTKDAGWAISSGDAYAGTKKAIFTGAGSGTIKTAGTYPATAGQVITATVKATVLDAADGATAFLKWYDASNVLIETDTGLESSVETGVWMQISVAGTAPANAAFVVFGVEATRTTGASVTIDDARWDYTAPLSARRMGYRAVQDALGVSGATEPTWPLATGDRVVDGTVIWEAVQLAYVEWTATPLLQSGATEPAWPTTVGAFVSDGTVNWECVSRRVEDENCPNSKVVAIIASKVFAADRDIIRFSATANPLDWSTRDDAGYLPSGLQQANSNDMAVLQPYRGNLGAWNANCFQMWQVDPDPAQMALLDQMDGVGSTHTLAATAVGNELYFVSAMGVRSVGIANAAENLQAGDVGMPIDVLVQAAIVQAAIDGKQMLSTYWPGMGQYWLCAGDEGVTAGAGGALAMACAPPNGGTSIPYTYTYTATGGTPPYLFYVVSGALPPGLTLNATTGVLSGTPTTAGTYSWGVQVIDALEVGAFCGWSAEVVETTVEIMQAVWGLISTDRLGASTDIWISEDALTWPDLYARSSAYTPAFAGVAHENGVSYLVKSGTTTASVLGPQVLGGSIATANYETSNGGARIYAIDGIVFRTHSANVEHAYAYSTDGGVSWNEVDIGLNMAGICRLNSGRWVALFHLNSTQAVCYSDQEVPTAWTDAGVGIAGSLGHDIACDGTTALFINNIGQVFTSTNGATWAVASGHPASVGSQDIFIKTSGAGVFIVGESNATRLYRTANSGASWTTVVLDPGGTRTCSHLLYANGTWVAGFSSTKAYISTNDGVSFVESALPFADSTIPIIFPILVST